MSTKTSVFTWEGIDRQGLRKTGELSAADLPLVKARLRQQGITAHRVRKKTAPLFAPRHRINAMDMARFTRQLATLAKAGVPLLQALELMAQGGAEAQLGPLARQLKQDIAAGSSLATALRNQPRYFDTLYCNLIDAGEQAGALDTLLDRVATYQEKSERLKARVKKALVYPLAVVVVAVIVSTILLIKVVPQFQSLFSGFGAQLPAFTLLVIALAEFLQAWWAVLFTVAVAAAAALRQGLRRSAWCRDALDRCLLRLPLVGTLLYKSALARYARTLATTFAAGVPLVQALNSVAGAMGSRRFSDTVREVSAAVASGTQLHVAMGHCGLFTPMAIQMTAIGEESGTLELMLEKIATFYEDEVDHWVDNLTSLLEPFIMAVLGVIVGGLVVAMYLPVFQLGTAI